MGFVAQGRDSFEGVGGVSVTLFDVIPTGSLFLSEVFRLGVTKVIAAINL